jgi:hypothetical protein
MLPAQGAVDQAGVSARKRSENSMELFSKYKAAALADVALGDCIVVRYSLGQDKGHRHTVAIKIARGEDERDAVGGISAVIALWSEEGSPPFRPTLMDLRNVVEVLEIPGAEAQLSSNPAHMFWTSDPPVGAFYLFGGEPHVLVEDGIVPRRFDFGPADERGPRATAQG